MLDTRTLYVHETDQWLADIASVQVWASAELARQRVTRWDTTGPTDVPLPDPASVIDSRDIAATIYAL